MDIGHVGVAQAFAENSEVAFLFIVHSQLICFFAHWEKHCTCVAKVLCSNESWVFATALVLFITSVTFHVLNLPPTVQ